jgi:hypothetical protein
MKLDLLFVAKRMTFLSDEDRSPGSAAIRSQGDERPDVSVAYAAKE